MLTKRTLEKWRSESLAEIEACKNYELTAISIRKKDYVNFLTHILSLTQELLDQRLLEKGRK
jgi:hypothetical protein